MPIVVSKKSGYIIAGHGRLSAAKIAGFTEVPIDEQDFDSEAVEYQYMIADNRIAELSEWDNAKLKDIIEELDTGEVDLNMLGYNEEELQRLMSQFHVDSPDDFPDAGEDIETTHQCPKCGYRWS